MIRSDPSHIEIARWLLSHEAAAIGAEDSGTTAAGRVYDKLVAHLAPLLGEAGVQLMLVRSARLAEIPSVESSVSLRERLHAQDGAVATESTLALFGTFLTLLTTFVGERLTSQLLRTAWPTFEPTTPTEPTK